MKLKNKKTGEIAVFGEGIIDLQKIGCKNAAEMIEAGWEDYEEPEGYWFIDCYSVGVESVTDNDDSVDKFNKEIGNYFETEEEAEQAVEKLKAWKRLKDNGFRFKGWTGASGSNNQVVYCDFGKADVSLLSLLFGGEDE